MKASQTLISKIKEFEGYKLVAYKCPAGVWTIGVGHTKGVYEGQKITDAKAESLLRGDILPCEIYISKLGLSQEKFDALVDFAFNLGIGNLEKSTLLKMIKAKAPMPTIRKEFMRWVFANGKRLKGLECRRQWEADRYEGLI